MSKPNLVLQGCGLTRFWVWLFCGFATRGFGFGKWHKQSENLGKSEGVFGGKESVKICGEEAKS